MHAALWCARVYSAQMAGEYLKIVHCKTAEILLAKLRPSHRLWRTVSVGGGGWIFRGQGSSEWDLIPSALRKGTRVGFDNDRSITSAGKSDCIEQMNAEFFAAIGFLETADSIGLRIAGDSVRIRQLAQNRSVVGSYIGRNEWPTHEVLELLALAQHHGVPTRLLDFSDNALVAAYFAARAAVGILSTSGGSGTEPTFSVYALNVDELRSITGGYEIRIVRVPRGHNVNLHAQHGVFVYDYGAAAADRASMSLVLGSLWRQVCRSAPSYGALPWLVRIDTPRSQAQQLLRLLDLERVNELHLRPSLEGAAHYLASRGAST